MRIVVYGDGDISKDNEIMKLNPHISERLFSSIMNVIDRNQDLRGAASDSDLISLIDADANDKIENTFQKHHPFDSPTRREHEQGQIHTQRREITHDFGKRVDKNSLVDEKTGRIMNHPRTDYFPCRMRTGTYKLPLKEIDYFKFEAKRIHVKTTDGREYHMPGCAADVHPYLNTHFCHPMKSIIVNLANIISMKDSTVSFASGTRYIMGQNNFHKLRHVYNDYL